MGLQHIAGSQNPVKTVASKTASTSNEVVVEIAGPYAAVAAMQPAYGADSTDFPPCPPGFTVYSSTVTEDGRGGGTLSVRCVNYGSPGGESFTPQKTVFNIDMAETAYDLQQHPKITASAATVKIVALWLNSSVEVQYSGSTGFSYTDSEGTTNEIAADSDAHRFCAAWQAGIKTFSRFYPVIEKVSVWSSLPGVSIVGNSMTGGTVSQFSADIGKWDNPPLSLTGYPAGNWFKSADHYRQNQDQTYTRTEQWTYSPDGSSGPHGWIYEASTANQGGGAS